jgi:hypothetical protein
MDIKIEATPRQTISIDLLGVEYVIVAPKAALALKLSVRSKQATNGQDPTLMVEALYEWLDVAFGKEKAGEVRDRLDDPADLLDIEHLSILMQKVTEVGSGNPTTSP